MIGGIAIACFLQKRKAKTKRTKNEAAKKPEVKKTEAKPPVVTVIDETKPKDPEVSYFNYFLLTIHLR